MAHQVTLKLNTSIVLYKDVEIMVRAGTSKLGTLLVSKGNIEWKPTRKSVKRHRFTWKQFAAKMAAGKPVKKRKRKVVK